MTTDQERDPLYANSRPGDLGEEIIEVGVERRAQRMQQVHNLGKADRATQAQYMLDAAAVAEHFERKRLIAWATGPDVRGATLQQLRAMKAAFDDVAERAKAAEGRPMTEYDEPLFDADPKCDHRVVPASGGGIRCRKCRGWFCF